MRSTSFQRVDIASRLDRIPVSRMKTAKSANMRHCRGKQPVFFLETKNVWAATLPALLEKFDASKRCVTNQHFPFSQLQHPAEHSKITIDCGGSDTL